MGNKRNLLVTLADSNYIEQAKQLFSSAYWNAGWDGDYMLLACEIAEKELGWFRDKGILIKTCAPLFNGSLGHRNYSTTVIAKFYLFSQELKKWDHVIFLDADIIVRASLDNLISTKGFSSPKTCKNYFRHYFTAKQSPNFSLLKKEYNLNRPAFNSGVISFNTSIIELDTFEKLCSVFFKYSDISNGDDSILNLYFYKQWNVVPIVFNVLVHNFGLKKFQAIILHFNKPADIFKKNVRPWEEGNPYYHEWKANLDKAQLIDLQNVQPGKKWNFFEIKIHSSYINMWIYINIMHDVLTHFFRHTPDRLIGKFGASIKRYYPKLYYWLKK
jgi:lipopolysaccharide biosynthesis glycosyltransferase